MDKWIDEYVDLMFGKNQNVEAISAAADLKLKFMPELLYKYRSINERSIDALQNDYLYSSQPENFNDVFEGAIGFNELDIKQNMFKSTYNSIRQENEYLPNRCVRCHRDLIENISMGFGGSYNDLEKNAPDLIKIMEERLEASTKKAIAGMLKTLRNMYNICCFSAVYNDVLMWSFYADSHKGFCIGYDIKGQSSNLTHCTFPVLYKTERLTISDLDYINGSEGMYALTIKGPKWSFEKEWRSLFPSRPPYNKELMPTPKVVYLGANINGTDKKMVEKICKGKGIKLYQMTLIPENQSLSAIKIIE